MTTSELYKNESSLAGPFQIAWPLQTISAVQQKTSMRLLTLPRSPRSRLQMDLEKKKKGASVVPNWPVRDQWEHLRKMERHFPLKPGQPIEMAFVILNSFSDFPN